MINIIRETLREELIIKSNPYIFEEYYVRNVLNIKKPLNESYYYSENLNKKILQEQLLLEGFWSGLSKLTGEIGSIFKVLYKIITNPETIVTWVNSVRLRVIRKPYTIVLNFLKSIIEKAKEFNLSKVSNIFSNILETFTELVTKILKTEGWKGALIVTCLGLVMVWIQRKIGKLIPTTEDLGVDEEFINSNKGVEWMTNISDVLTSQFGELSSLDPSGVLQVIDWAKKVFNGVDFVVDTLRPAVSRYETRTNR